MTVTLLTAGCLRGGFDPGGDSAAKDAASDDLAPDTGDLTPDGVRADGPAAGGPRWPGLGPSATDGISGSADAHNLRLRVAADGVVYAAWAESSSGDYEIYLKRWTGATWEGLAGSDAPGGLSRTAGRESRLGGLASDPDNLPLVTWMERKDAATPAGIYVRRYAAGAWQPLGASATGPGLGDGGNVYWPDAAVDSAGRPVVVWEQLHSGEYWALLAARWDGSAWTGLDGSDQVPGISGEAVSATLSDVAAGPDETLHVVWHEKNHSVGVYHRVFDGSAWQVLTDDPGGRVSPESEPEAGWAHVAVHQGHPVVLWEVDDGLRIRRHDGQAWVPLGVDGALHEGLAEAGQCELIVDRQDRIIAAFVAHDSVGTNVHLRVWTGAAWQPMVGSPLAGGMTNSPGFSHWPTLGAGPDGVVVGWEEVLANGRRAYFIAKEP